MWTGVGIGLGLGLALPLLLRVVVSWGMWCRRVESLELTDERRSLILKEDASKRWM